MSAFTAPDGVDIHYREIGRGPALVLLPGLGASSKMWGDPPSPLTDHFRLLMMDPRGVGGSRMDPERISLESWSGDAGALLDHLGIERAHVLGASLGAIIALDFAARHPERIETLALITAAAKSTPHLNNVLACLRDLANALPGDLFLRTFAVLALLPASIDRSPRIVQHFIDAFDPADIPGLVNQCNVLLKGFDLTFRLEGLPLHALVISSMYDPITPIDYGEAIADQLKARRVRLKKSGHAPLLEEPQNILPALVRFWNHERVGE